MSTLSSEPLSRSIVARLPFFWWREQTDWPARQPSRKTASVPADDSYIPSGTADLWRSARLRPQR